jgi:hypothetical protein
MSIFRKQYKMYKMEKLGKSKIVLRRDKGKQQSQIPFNDRSCT